MFATTFIEIFKKNIKTEEKVKADDNLSPSTGLSGKALNNTWRARIALALRKLQAVVCTQLTEQTDKVSTIQILFQTDISTPYSQEVIIST